MNVRILTTDQRSDAWRAARLGYLTGSSAADMLATLKGKGEAASRRNLRIRLVLERLTQMSHESDYVSGAMQYGIDREPDARGLYEVQTGFVVQSSGFLAHSDLMAGCSPDGLIGEAEGLVELKCCHAATHLEYLRTQHIPSDYLAQITHNLWITGAAWADWVSFDDRFPASLRLLIVRVTRRELGLAAYEEAARAFLKEVDTECAELTRMALTGVAA